MERDGVDHLDTVWRAIRLAAMERIAHDDPSEEELERLLGRRKRRRSSANGSPTALPIEGQGAGEAVAAPAAEQHTTSLSVGDRAGNLVCITQSLGGEVRLRRGRARHRRMPEQCALLGRARPAATNALVPGRTLTTPMAPSVATRGGAPVLALGTPGSYGICQTQAQALVQYRGFRAAPAGGHRGAARRGCGTAGGSPRRAGWRPRAGRAARARARHRGAGGLDGGAGRDAGRRRRPADRGDDRRGGPAAGWIRGGRLRPETLDSRLRA